LSGIASNPSVWLGSGERLVVPLKMTTRRSSYDTGARLAWASMKAEMESGIGVGRVGPFRSAQPSSGSATTTILRCSPSVSGSGGLLHRQHRAGKPTDAHHAGGASYGAWLARWHTRPPVQTPPPARTHRGACALKGPARASASSGCLRLAIERRAHKSSDRQRRALPLSRDRLPEQAWADGQSVRSDVVSKKGQLGPADYSVRKRLSLPVASVGMLSTSVTVTVGFGHPEPASASSSVRLRLSTSTAPSAHTLIAAPVGVCCT
jgi:hypothetical protein